jgi:SAM-dependent methyltransferase
MNPDDNHHGWANRSGDFSPAYYAEIGPNEVSETLVTVFDHFAPDDPAVLEIGCSSGRHLAHLLDHGYEDLTGIDLNDESFEVMAEYHPQTCSRSFPTRSSTSSTR